MGRKSESGSRARSARRGAVLLACVCLALTLSLVASSAGSEPSFAGPRFYPTGAFISSVAVGDLNGDGRPDLAASHSDEFPNLSVLLNRGDGSFRQWRDYEAGEDSFAIAIGDVNGDANPDLATTNGDASTVSVLLNRGNATFRTKRDYGTGKFPASVAIGDLNSDAKPDLATANVGANTVSVLLNRGDGSFQAKRDYETGRGPGSIALGDLNGDGKADLATANRDANSVSVLLNGGDGSFRVRRDYRTGKLPASVAIGDLTGDGKPELATANSGANNVSVRLNGGDGSFLVRRDYRTGSLPQSVAIGDLNRDDRADLATTNVHFRANGVSVLLNRGDGSLSARRDYSTGVESGPVSVAIDDLNGDGKPDLVTATGGFRAQFNSGVTVLANSTGFCGVPSVAYGTLLAAKQAIARADCRVGSIRRIYSTTLKRGLVISQRPKSGRVLPLGAKVNLVVSRGRQR